MDSSKVNSYLDTFVNFESQLHKLRPEDFYLNRIYHFLELLGNPTKGLKIVHVAGTKGKGSSCAFIASILHEAGYKVGLYTSPHLHKVNERIRVLTPENLTSKDRFKGAISDDELASVLTSLRPFAATIKNEGNILTYFEVLTVAALCYFARRQVDIVVLETGLGGRLDATNAVDSAVAVITPISLDHMRLLGSTLSQIAFEKAGIIKNSQQKVVIAPQDSEVLEVILKRCQEFGAQFLIVDQGKSKGLGIGLKGKHQRINAAVAIEVTNILRTIGFKINDEQISAGLKNVIWPGRFEVLKKDPVVVVDCAHNGASAQALSQTLIEEYPDRRVILVLGISQDKDAAAICYSLKVNVAQIFLTKADHPRAHLFKEAECKEYFGDLPFEIIESLGPALEKALQIAGPKDVILVAGSVFIVAEAIEYLKTKGN